MNSYTISLSSNSTTYTQTLPLQELEDHTLVSLNLENLYNDVIPLFVKINWGDGTTEVMNNDIYGDRFDNQLTFFTYNPVFINAHTHEYYPSSTSNYKLLSSQVLVQYSDGNYGYFLIPIQVKTYDKGESMGRVELTNINVLENTLEYQLTTSTGLVEMRTSRR